MSNRHLAADKITLFLLPFTIFWFVLKRPAFIVESRFAQTQLPLLNWPISDLIIGGCALVVYGGVLAPWFASKSKPATRVLWHAFFVGWLCAWMASLVYETFRSYF